MSKAAVSVVLVLPLVVILPVSGSPSVVGDMRSQVRGCEQRLISWDPLKLVTHTDTRQKLLERDLLVDPARCLRAPRLWSVWSSRSLTPLGSSAVEVDDIRGVNRLKFISHINLGCAHSLWKMKTSMFSATFIFHRHLTDVGWTS